MYCAGCGKGCGGMRYTDYPDNPYVTVVSTPLTKHINADRNKINPFCYDMYINRRLVLHEQNHTHYNFTTSRITSGDECIPIRKQVGLPTPSRNNHHRTINNYTIFSPGLDFDQSVIDSLLPEEHDANEEFYEPTGEGPLLDDPTADSPQEDFHARPSTNGFVIDSEKKLFTVKPSNERLLVEVDLMNEMAKFKMPLAAFESIMRWAYRSQTKGGFCFSKMDLCCWCYQCKRKCF